MNLTPEQTKAVADWIAAGDNLSAVQKKLSDQFKLSLTYRDVRFLVDDLNLEIKDAAPKVDATDVTKAQARPAPATEKKGFFDKAKEKLGLGKEEADEELPPEEDMEDADLEEAAPEPGLGNVQVTVDKVTLLPGALASGTVTFSDGVTGKWIVDQYGRPGLTEISKPGYRPTAADSQAFMQELSMSLQRRGY
ncbi:hypothetical protein [Opitutus sp. ER46]|uniref:hypothetical protein n=1 Tax=Opitutus sp. ER46 TaxID=2161864 RepID=UPI000D31C566|nr:hypothetical protein [Opitutus sp. ER46]PTX91277.1 hypothetical protein DB354_18550 [Opitutus sp. ER46]